MTIEELLVRAYAAALSVRMVILATAVGIPVVGTLLARVGKAGKTDADGRFIANLVIGIGLVGFMLEVVALLAARAVPTASLLHADVVLVVAPIVCLLGCLGGIRLVFPLNQLASVRTFVDIAAFIAACLGVLWLFSKFRGWGLVFFGGISEMVAIGVLGIALLKRLYGRAFGRKKSP
jgi:hypothetical protein